MVPETLHPGPLRPGAAVVGFFSSFIAILVGIPLGRVYDGTQLPLITGFTVLGMVGLGLVFWAGRDSTKILSS